MEAQEICKTNLLADDPAPEDAFGGHKRIADALFGLFREERGGKSIAITGSWGSGKSTVINILNSRIQKGIEDKDSLFLKPKINIFTFDAWEHHGDPLKRVFLESLINYLDEVGLIKKDEYKKEIENLEKRNQEDKEETIPEIRPQGLAIGASIFLAPVAYALILKFPPFDIASYFPSVVVGFVLLILPFILILFFTVWNWILPKEHEGHSLLAQFITKTYVIKKKIAHRQPDPTSIEFQKLFQRVLKDAIEDENNKLIVVIDNLDRLPQEESLTIWSTMKSFFPKIDSQNCNWIKNFWLIVPFDRKNLKDMWDGDKARAREGGQDGEKSSKGYYFESFMDKTFQTEFKVSPPLLSDWKRYFMGQLSRAFPDHEGRKENDLERVYRLFKSHTDLSGNPITPRDITVFINKMGVLHRQWADSVPLLYQGLFVLYSDKIITPYTDLAEKDFINKEVLNTQDLGDYQKYLATLYFNVPPDRAAEVLIGKGLYKALIEGDKDEMRKMENYPFLPVVLDHSLEANIREWAENNPEYIANAAFALGDMEGKFDKFSTSWSKLQKGVMRIKWIQKLNDSAAQGFIEIDKSNGDKSKIEITEKIINLFTDLEALEAEEEIKAEELDSWGKSLAIFMNYLNESKKFKDFRENIRINAISSNYLELISKASEFSSQDVLRYLRPKINPDSVIEKIIEFVDSEYGKREYEQIKLLMQMEVEWPWNALIEKYDENLRTLNIAEPSIYLNITKSILDLRIQVNSADEALEALCAEGYIFHYLNNFKKSKQISAINLYLLFNYLPIGNPSGVVGNSSAGVNIYQAFLKNPENSAEELEGVVDVVFAYKFVEKMVEANIGVQQLDNVVRIILKRLIGLPDIGNFMSTKFMIKEFSHLEKLLGEEDAGQLIQKFCDDGNIVEGIKGHPFELELTNFYRISWRKLRDSERQKLTLFLIKELQGLGEDVWKNQLEDEGELLELLIEFRENNIAINLEHKFRDSLLQHSKEFNEVSEALVLKWKHLVSSLKKDEEITFKKSLWSILFVCAANRLSAFLGLYGEMLLETGESLSSHDSDKVIRETFDSIIKDNEKDQISWVCRALSSCPNIYSNAENSSKESLKDRLISRINESEDSDIKTLLMEVAEKINLDLSDLNDSKGEGENQKDE